MHTGSIERAKQEQNREGCEENEEKYNLGGGYGIVMTKVKVKNKNEVVKQGLVSAGRREGRKKKLRR